MARMLPDVDPSQLQHASEEPVYVALRDQLGDDYMRYGQKLVTPDQAAA